MTLDSTKLNSCSLHSSPGSKEHHFLWLHLAPELWRAAEQRMDHEGLSRACLAPRFRQWDALTAESTGLGADLPSKELVQHLSHLPTLTDAHLPLSSKLLEWCSDLRHRKWRRWWWYMLITYENDIYQHLLQGDSAGWWRCRACGAASSAWAQDKRHKLQEHVCVPSGWHPLQLLNGVWGGRGGQTNSSGGPT